MAKVHVLLNDGGITARVKGFAHSVAIPFVINAFSGGFPAISYMLVLAVMYGFVLGDEKAEARRTFFVCFAIAITLFIGGWADAPLTEGGVG
jgi:hypothetical protein